MSEALEKPTQPVAPTSPPHWQEEAKKRYQKGKRHPVKLKQAEEDSEALSVAYDPSETMPRLYETTGFGDQDAAMKLLNQVSEAQAGSDSLFNKNTAFSFLNGLAPENPLEGLLAAQMAAAHNLSMEFARRAMATDNAEQIDRNLNRAAKMMRTFTAQAEALQKIRNKGQQKITVQHVQVGHGGQAIIGDVHQGGGTGA